MNGVRVKEVSVLFLSHYFFILILLQQQAGSLEDTLLIPEEYDAVTSIRQVF